MAHTLFVGANDKPRAGELINVLREAKQEVPEDLLKFGTAGNPVTRAGAQSCAAVAPELFLEVWWTLLPSMG